MKAAPMTNKPSFPLMKQGDIQNIYHLQMPRWLFTDSRYMGLALETKVAYTFLLNRFQLSRLNGWVNEDGAVFIIYTRRSLAEEMQVSYRKIIESMKELSAAGLIWEKRCGRGDANQIYLALVEHDQPKGGSAPFVGPEHEAAGGTPEGQPFAEDDEPDVRSAEPALLDGVEFQGGASLPAVEVPEQHFKKCGDGTSASAGMELPEVPEWHPIAKKLDGMGVLSPMEYKQAKGVNFGSGYKVHSKAAWSAVAVRRILTDVVYLGIMEQAKRTTPNYKVKREIQRPREEWIRVEGTHDPIISQEDFDLVARLLLLDTRSTPGGKAVYPLSGLLYCGDCRSSMARKPMTVGGQTYQYYICSGHKRNATQCSTHTVRAETLEQAVLDGINFHIRSVSELREALEAISQRPSQKLEVSKLNRRMDTLQKDLENAREVKDSLYRRYAMGEVELEDFQQFKRVFEKDCQKAEQAIAAHRVQLEAILNSGDPASPWIKYFERFGRVEELTRAIAVKFIEQVNVFEGGKLEIAFRYQEEYEMASQFLAMHRQDRALKEAV